jgi:hypothetical protein
MRDGTRLALDISISAAFAVVAAAIGLVAGLLVALFIWRIFFPDADSIGLGLIMAGFAAFCGLVSGVFAFPLCGEWLHERRKTLKAEQSAPSQNPCRAG